MCIVSYLVSHHDLDLGCWIQEIIVERGMEASTLTSTDLQFRYCQASFPRKLMNEVAAPDCSRVIFLALCTLLLVGSHPSLECSMHFQRRLWISPRAKDVRIYFRAGVNCCMSEIPTAFLIWTSKDKALGAQDFNIAQCDVFS